MLAGVLTSEPDCQERAELEAERVPLLVHDLREFYRKRGARLGDRAVRREYDAGTAAMLRRYRPDLVVLSGYLYVLTEPMLEAFPSRIVNIHDSDLAVADRDGRPRYRALHSTRDAIVAGERETRSTVHLVTEEVDVGPILVRSWPFDVHPLVDDARRWQATDILKAYAYAHREWMMRAAWGPLLAKTIQLFARGEVSVEFGGVRVAGDPVPWVWRRCPSETPSR